MTPVKEKLMRGEAVLMVNVNYPAPGLVPILAEAGADAVFIDCELGAHSLIDVDNLVTAAHLAGIGTFLRPDCPEPWALARYLARGIDGLMVPHMEGVGTAARIVETIRYFRPDDHEHMTTIVMVESLEGLKALPDMLATDGIDVVFCGSGDLARSMGYHDKTHPDVQAKVAEIMRTITAGGKVAGRFVRFDNVRECVEAGVGLLYIHANHFLLEGARNFRERMAGSA